MTRLEAITHAEEANIKKLQAQKISQEEEIEVSERDILRLKEELNSSQEVLDDRKKEVDAAKKAALKVSKILDQALKEIAGWVSGREFLINVNSETFLRMMRLRNFRLSVLLCTEDVGWRKSSCLSLREICGTYLWKRSVDFLIYGCSLFIDDCVESSGRNGHGCG